MIRDRAFGNSAMEEYGQKNNLKVKSMEFIEGAKIKILANPGVVSRQLLNPDNSTGERVTITEVHLEAGAFQAGDVVRFADKDVHGLLNDGDVEFVDISVTAPPIHFGYAYKDRR